MGIIEVMESLRAPNRLQELDPMVLRETADSLGREEIMSKFSRAGNIEELIDLSLIHISEPTRP